MTPADIVRYWRSVELLQPQAAPKLKKREMPHQSYIHDVSVANPVMPWDKTSKVRRKAKCGATSFSGIATTSNTP